MYDTKEILLLTLNLKKDMKILKIKKNAIYKETNIKYLELNILFG
jgi:hypothetical protein